MYQQIGICDQCGGPVMLYIGPWMGTIPPVATCQRCGATEAGSQKVIKMVPNRKRQEYDFSGSPKTEYTWSTWMSGRPWSSGNGWSMSDPRLMESSSGIDYSGTYDHLYTGTTTTDVVKAAFNHSNASFDLTDLENNNGNPKS